jgi:hypothetical protein
MKTAEELAKEIAEALAAKDYKTVEALEAELKALTAKTDGMPWVEPFDPLGAFECQHGSFGDFDGLRFTTKAFKGKVKKTNLLKLHSVDTDDVYCAMQGSYTAFATEHPDDDLVEVWEEGDKKLWRVNPDVIHSRSNGIISVN